MYMIDNDRINEVLVVTDEVIEKVTVLVNKIKPLQDKLNKKLAMTDDYAKTLKVSNGKYINYGDCITSECDEVRNSTPWKHWKFALELDKDNLNLEIADIFHFTPSIELVIEANISDVSLLVLNKDRLIHEVNGVLGIINYIKDYKDMYMELNDIINCVNHTMSCNGSIVAALFSRLKYTGNLSDSELNDLNAINMEIMLLAIYIHQFVFNTTIDESIEMIYNTYVIKNTLNEFRNTNGYNTGDYNKIWVDGREDNMVAMDIMSKHPEYTPEDLYKELYNVYYEDIKIHLG